MLYYHRKTYDVLVYGGNMIISKVSEERKKDEKRGEGHGADYKPYIRVNEFNSKGTTSNPVDWITGRTMQLLSQGEMLFYYILRWDSSVVDIREQFPLDLEATLHIAKNLHIRHPKNKNTRMTSDFLVDYLDGRQVVYSVKRSRSDIEEPRTKEKLLIEKVYWNQRGIDFVMIYAEELNISYVTNIRIVTEFYNLEDVFDDISMIKHLIATRQIAVDLTCGLIDFSKLKKELGYDNSK